MGLKAVQGSEDVITIEFTDDNDDPINITSQTILFTMKIAVTDSDTDPDSVDKTGVVTDGAGGIATVTLLKTDTTNPGLYLCDVKRMDGTTPIASDTFNYTITKAVTQRES